MISKITLSIKIMISKITLENFFSFKHPTIIELNPDVNILVGINGSGKSNFIKAIHLLAESIIGNGLESVLLKEWSGFNAVINFNQSEKDAIKLSFEFDKNVINNVMMRQKKKEKKGLININHLIPTKFFL